MAPTLFQRFAFSDGYDEEPHQSGNDSEDLVDAFLEMSPGEQQFAVEMLSFLSTDFAETSKLAEAEHALN